MSRSELKSESSRIGNDAITGTCPRCRTNVSFKKHSYPSDHDDLGSIIAVKCNSCGFISTYSISEGELFPNPERESLENLPDTIDQYYQEAIRCIEADAPNGAATVFRKVLSAVCAHYDITDVEDNAGFYEMINKLHKEGHIVEKQRKALLATKDAGNDGAHLNANDPDIETAEYLKDVIESILLATIKADQNISHIRDEHPNPHQE